MIIRTDTRLKRIVLWVLAVCILGPASVGFVEKLMLFIKAVQKDQVAGFTIIPVVNYFIVTAGMICLLCWAIAHGMFRDVEKPKYDMLEREQSLDRRDGINWEVETDAEHELNRRMFS